jgi:hypothetical protein
VVASNPSNCAKVRKGSHALTRAHSVRKTVLTKHRYEFEEKMKNKTWKFMFAVKRKRSAKEQKNNKKTTPLRKGVALTEFDDCGP